MNEVSPLDPQHAGKPLWCVYGPDCFPSLICCRIKDGNIWGYSVWKRQPGFRTLGISLEAFAKERETPRFYAAQADALERLAKITTPKNIA